MDKPKKGDRITYAPEHETRVFVATGVIEEWIAAPLILVEAKPASGGDLVLLRLDMCELA